MQLLQKVTTKKQQKMAAYSRSKDCWQYDDDNADGVTRWQYCTTLAGIIDQDDLGDEGVWWPHDDTPQSSQKCGPGLIVKHNHYAGRRHHACVVGFLLAAASTEHAHLLDNTRW